jgi:hypothetical protein
MPNYITNILTLKGSDEKIKEVVESIQSEERVIDFNKIIELPDELKGTSAPTTIISQKKYDEQESLDNPKNPFMSRGITKKMSKDLIVRFGADNWYDWCILNWGVKWNASECVMVENGKYEFITAWSTPFMLFIKASVKFPEVEIEVQYADEDLGYNVGTYNIKNGECIKQFDPVGGSYEAFDMSVRLNGDLDCYIFSDLIYDIVDNADGELDKILEDVKNGVESYEAIVVKMIYNREVVNEKYPKKLIAYLLEVAISNENYGYASKLRDVMRVEI